MRTSQTVPKHGRPSTRASQQHDTTDPTTNTEMSSYSHTPSARGLIGPEPTQGRPRPSANQQHDTSDPTTKSSTAFMTNTRYVLHELLKRIKNRARHAAMRNCQGNPMKRELVTRFSNKTVYFSKDDENSQENLKESLHQVPQNKSSTPYQTRYPQSQRRPSANQQHDTTNPKTERENRRVSTTSRQNSTKPRVFSTIRRRRNNEVDETKQALRDKMATQRTMTNIHTHNAPTNEQQTRHGTSHQTPTTHTTQPSTQIQITAVSLPNSALLDC